MTHCYFGAEMCARGHQPDCPAIGLHESIEKYIAFFGARASTNGLSKDEILADLNRVTVARRDLNKATPMPSAEDDARRHRTATAGGCLGPGGAVVMYPNSWAGGV